MYKQAAIEARREREEQLFNDWTEWAELDEESKQYVRDYLSDEWIMLGFVRFLLSSNDSPGFTKNMGFS